MAAEASTGGGQEGADVAPPALVVPGALHEPQRTYAAVSFDLDDTLWANAGVLAAASVEGQAWLLRTHPELAPALEAAPLAARMGALHASRPDLAHCYTALRLEAMREVLQEGGVAEAAREDTLAAGLAHYLTHRSAVTLWPGVLHTLATLRDRGYLLAALSNGNVDVEQVPGLAPLLHAHVHPAKVRPARRVPQRRRCTTVPCAPAGWSCQACAPAVRPGGAGAGGAACRCAARGGQLDGGCGGGGGGGDGGSMVAQQLARGRRQ